ncbi:MAG: excinuclease ABC subunit UvrA [Promethearchaeota archaeon]
MPKNEIVVIGARMHNLKNITARIPRDKLVVLTGISGSGKSSLAFDTIYAEGQRRYIESLSSYARQFLGQMDKPDVDHIDGLSPAISIEQRPASANPRSTVGTVTEIYDYLRLLFARIGTPHCPTCGKVIKKQTVDQIVENVLKLPKETKILVLSPIVSGRKGTHQQVFENAKKEGFVRVRVDGEILSLDEEIKLDKNKKHSIEIVVDRLVLKSDIRKRLADSVETALKMSGGTLFIHNVETKETIPYSEDLACPACNLSFPEILTPRMFSFNSPYGACPECDGLGFKMEIDSDLIIPDKTKSILDEGIRGPVAASNENSYTVQMMSSIGEKYGFDLDTPFKDFTEKQLHVLLYGTKDRRIKFKVTRDDREVEWNGAWEGIINNLERRYRETRSDWMREEIEKYMSTAACPVCNGDRLRPEVLAVTIHDKNIADVTKLTVKSAAMFFETLREKLTDRELLIVEQVLREIQERLGFLNNVGIDYLTLDRQAGTLSVGEAQRIHLATQIGSALVGVLYVLDEPTIGLHARDCSRLISTLLRLRDLGNTVLVVEHDPETILTADWILDMGPGAGLHGGEIVAEGPPDAILANENSLTGQYLSGKKKIPTPKKRREPNEEYLLIKGAQQFNLKNIDVKIPLHVFTCITGVSGSGKSTLINEILYKSLARQIYGSKERPGAHDNIIGLEYIDKVIRIDQSPIGRTPRSNPSTYTGVFTPIRELFAKTPDARVRGYKPGRFSFNVKGGRCEFCRGHGINRIEMHFLPDVYVPCEVCKGKRFTHETLSIAFRDKNIADVLDMSVEEALEFFKNIPVIKRRLQTLYDVGLGYIKLGQPATTLSGGEAQRVKLAKELGKKPTGKTVYILDEPTTGLHFDDIRKLLNVLNRLTSKGNTVIVIEHNLDVIKTADYIIDLGPEGGDDGGTIVAEGTPEEIMNVRESHTGRFLEKYLAKPQEISKIA